MTISAVCVSTTRFPPSCFTGKERDDATLAESYPLMAWSVLMSTPLHLVYRLRNDYTGSVCFARWILRRMSSPLAFQV